MHFRNNKGWREYTYFCLPIIGALVLCMSVAVHAAETGELGPATVASKFVDALQHRQFKDAAAMLSPSTVDYSPSIERTLSRIDESLGGFSTMHPIPTLPDGKSIRFIVLDERNTIPASSKFMQIRYTSTVSDGQPVFYELNLIANGTSLHVLSFGVHFPALDARLIARADHLIRLISR